VSNLPSVLILISDLDGEGGMQRHAWGLARMLADGGASVSIITRNYLKRPVEERIGDILIRRTAVGGPPDPRAVRGAPRASVANAVTSLSYAFFGLIWALRHRSRYSVIHCQQMFGSLLLGMAVRLVSQKPVIVRVTLSGARGEVAQLRRMPLAWLRLMLVRRVDHWIALTKEMADEIATLGVRTQQIAIIPNAAEPPPSSATDPVARAEARARLGLGEEPLIVFAGRLSAEKGIDVLLRAMADVRREHPSARLIILGGGGPFSSEEQSLKDFAASILPEDGVTFAGHVDDVMPYLVAAGVFALPTSSEGLSNALVEAMAAGAAAITTDIPAHGDILRDGENAILVPRGDRVALATALSSVLSDESLRRRLGENARRTAVEALSPAATLERYVNVCRGLEERGSA
jgi:glycosyltransferase involved in cell wall biosynthesis